MSTGRQAARSESTRSALLETARKLFADRGYADTPTEEIVRLAGVTRGALYHHFRDKRDLFTAVFEQLEVALGVEMASKTAPGTDAWTNLIAGSNAFLDACLKPDVQRIVLIDGPSVLGRDTWRALEEQHGLGLIAAGLTAAMQQGFLPRQPVAPLAHVLLAAINEAGLLIAQADDLGSARAEVGAAVTRLLEGLRAR